MASPVPLYASLPADAASPGQYSHSSHFHPHHSSTHSHSHSHSHTHSYYGSGQPSDELSPTAWPYSPKATLRSAHSSTAAASPSFASASASNSSSSRPPLPSLPSVAMYSQYGYAHGMADSYVSSPSAHSQYERSTHQPMLAAAARSSPAAYRHLPATATATATATAVASPHYAATLPASHTVASGKPRAPRFIDTFQSRILSHPPAPVSPSSSTSPSSPTGSPVPASASSKPKRKRRTPTLDPYTKHIRSVKHNEAEVRRRQRLNGLLVELAECVGCRKPQKSAILRVTLEKVRAMERKIGALEDAVRQARDGSQNAHAKEEPENEEEGRGRSKKKARTIKMAMETDSGLYESAYGLPALSPLTGPTSSGSSSSSSSSSSVSSSSSSSSAASAWSAGFDGFGGLGGPSNAAASGLADVSLPSPLPLSLFPPSSASSSAPTATVAQSTHSTDAYQSRAPLPVASQPSDALHDAAYNHVAVKQELTAAVDGAGASSGGVLLRPGQLNVLKAACVPMNVVDLNGSVLDCNAAFEQFLGYSLATLRSSSFTFFDYTHPASLNTSFADLSSLIADDQRPLRGEKMYVSASGEVRQARTTLFMLRDGEGRHNHVAVLLEPVHDDGMAATAAAAVGGDELLTVVAA